MRKSSVHPKSRIEHVHVKDFFEDRPKEPLTRYAVPQDPSSVSSREKRDTKVPNPDKDTTRPNSLDRKRPKKGKSRPYVNKDIEFLLPMIPPPPQKEAVSRVC